MSQPRTALAALLVVLLAADSLVLADLQSGWDRPLLGLLLAWPAALALERVGPARPMLSLLAGGLVAGLAGRAWLGDPAGRELPLLFHLSRLADAPLAVLALGAIGAAAPAPLLLVRREPAGIGAQLLAGAAGGALLLAAILPDARARSLPALLCAVCLVAGSGIGLAAGLSPAAGEPRPRSLGLLLGGAAGAVLLGALLGGGARAALTPRGEGGAAEARAALRAIHAAQEAHRARTGAWARDPGELAGVDSAVLSGCAHGHLFRFARGETGWAVAADTLAPPLGGHLAIDERGELEERREPIRLDPR